MSLNELDALWYWLEPMCDRVEAPLCYTCSDPMTLTPPELLYYTCDSCDPASKNWSPLTDENLHSRRD